jgi:hypothetical protein
LPPLPPLPEASAAAEAEQASEGSACQQGGEEGQGWSAWARTTLLDEPAVESFLTSGKDFEFSTWAEDAPALGDAAEAEPSSASEAAGGFEFVDATADPSLDPVAQLEAQAAAAAGQADGAEPYSPGYDDIREGGAYATLGDSSALNEWGEGDADENGAEQQSSGRRRVWVLLGGDGGRRTQSLQAGLHAFLRWGRAVTCCS